MKWFAETTEWSNSRMPNHVYLLNDSKSKMYAYRPFGIATIKVFKNPITIDVRGRKFKLNRDQYNIDVNEPEPVGRRVEVHGSRGDVYTVSESDGQWSCTCTGFKFRGHCRHIESVSQSV